MKDEIYFEQVIEKIGDKVIASNIREATDNDIAEAWRLHILGNCPHTIIKDEPGYMYDFRNCVTCGKGLGWYKKFIKIL